MELIPVIDLLHGEVVRAIRGERHAYRPMRSALCNACDPQGVAGALLRLYPFKTLYIADLDAIQGIGSNLAFIAELRRAFPVPEIWVDAGIGERAMLQRLREAGLRGVVGSERLQTMDQYAQIFQAQEQDVPLSLDFGDQGFLGPRELLAHPEVWPQNVICMTLGSVGSKAGPDFDQLAKLQRSRNHGRLYAAGGVRNLEDLISLQSRGISGALVASALHDREISPADIQHLLHSSPGAMA